jgi:hypothetical protein
MLRRLVHDAMRGDVRAFKLLLSLVQRYAESPDTAVPLEEVLAEDKAILAQFLQVPGGLVSDTAKAPDREDRGDAK